MTPDEARRDEEALHASYAGPIDPPPTYTRDGRTIWYHYGRPDDAVVALCDDVEGAEMIVAALACYLGEGANAVPEMDDLRAEIDRLTRENAHLRDDARRKQALLETAERRALLYERAILGMARRISKTGLARVVPPDERTEPELNRAFMQLNEARKKLEDIRALVGDVIPFASDVGLGVNIGYERVRAILASDGPQ